MIRSTHRLVAWVALSAVILLATLAPHHFTTAAHGQTATRQTPSVTSSPAPIHDLLTPEEWAWLRAHPVIRVAQDPSWPPIEFTDESGQPAGVDNDYLKLVEQRLGITFERVPVSDWQDAYARLQRWEIDMTPSVTRTPAREEFWAFTRPYLELPIVIVTRQNVAYIARMSELEGRRVAAVEGYIAEEFISRDFPRIDLVRVKSAREGLRLLERDEAFAFVGNMLVIGHYMVEDRLANLKVAGETPYVNAQCMAVRKDWAPLAAILQKALNSISDSEHAGIYEKWVPVRYEHGFDYRRFWSVLAAFAVIVAGMGLWIGKLWKEIRARKLAVEALRESEERYHSLFESAGDAIFLLANDRFLDCNSRTLAMFGCTRDQILNAHPSDFSPEVQPDGQSSRDKAGARIAAAYAGETQCFEWSHSRADGTTFDAEVTLSRVSICGQPHLLAIVRDITDRLRAEKEKRALIDQLIQAQKMEAVGRLASGVAHDFNNLLTVICGHLDLIREQLPRGSAQGPGGCLEPLDEAVRQATGLTRSLLTFARKVPGEKKPTDLRDVVGRTLKLIRRVLPASIELAEGIAETGPVWVLADDTQIQQVLMNLAVNARDAMPEGGRLTIGLDEIVTVRGAFARLVVADTGIGITPEIRAHLFEPFFTTKPRGAGTGLGLAIIHGIVEEHCGHVEVHSADGEGTTFEVFLPRSSPGAKPSVAAPALPRRRAQGERILLAEDNVPIVELLRGRLEADGYRLIVANSGDAVLEAYRQHAAALSLLLLDVDLPKRSGVDCLLELRAAGSKTPAILITGSMDFDRSRPLPERTRLLRKPFQLGELVQLMNELLPVPDASLTAI